MKKRSLSIELFLNVIIFNELARLLRFIKNDLLYHIRPALKRQLSTRSEICSILYTHITI